MRKIKNALGDEKLKAILTAERTNSLGTTQASDLSEQRIRAFEYYVGEMSDMPALDGESSAISSDVQDVVEGVLPIIVDVLMSTENLAVFKPTGPNDVEAAQQETDYINYLFFQENQGFLTLLTAVKDGLLSKNGFVKWWMEDDEDRTHETYEGLTADAYALITADDSLTLSDVEQYEAVDPATGQKAAYFNCVTETTKKVKRAKIAAVPPEEILVSKNSRNTRDLTYWAHISRKPQADVVAAYEDKEEAIRKAPSAFSLSDNSEAVVRQTVQDNQDSLQTSDDVNRDMRMIEVAEHYIRLALEEDKVPRRYKIVTLSNFEVLDIEEVTNWPFATGTPIIMPHRLFGRAIADLVIDIQRVKTSLLRATLNNAYYANNARTEVSETHASENTIDDLLNNRVGGIVRTKMPGGLQQLETQSIGHWTLPLIEHMNETRENRTGVSRYNQGLDADSLNHTATGITRIMDAAEMRVKMMARVFAETLIVDTYRGLHEMVMRYNQEPQTVELRGKWVTIDPRQWNSRKHMKVNLPLGGASKQQLIGFFAQMLGIQKEVLMQQGTPNGPLISYQNIYATVEQMVKLAGIPGVEPFFMKPPPPDPTAPPPPNPKMVEAQTKAQIADNAAQHKAQLQQQQMMFDQRMEQMRAERDHQREMDELQRQMMMDKVQMQHDLMLAQVKAGHDMRIDAYTAQQDAKTKAQSAAQSGAE